MYCLTAQLLATEPDHASASKAMDLCISYEDILAEKERVQEEQQREVDRERAEQEAKQEAEKALPPSASPPASSGSSGQKLYKTPLQGAVSVTTTPVALPTAPDQQQKKESGECFSYDQLKAPGPYPPGAEKDREQLLSAEDFLEVGAHHSPCIFLLRC